MLEAESVIAKDKFTPGPWHVNTIETVLYSVHANRGGVAEVSRGTMNEISADEIESNARLIAAAPELLAALEAALRLDYFNEHNQLADMARKAVANAKGTK